MCDPSDFPNPFVPAAKPAAPGTVVDPKAFPSGFPLLAGVKAQAAQDAKDILKAPPPVIDPTDLIIRNAMAAERRRNAASGMGSSFLTGPGGLTKAAPIGLPKASGF